MPIPLFEPQYPFDEGTSQTERLALLERRVSRLQRQYAEAVDSDYAQGRMEQYEQELNILNSGIDTFMDSIAAVEGVIDGLRADILSNPVWQSQTYTVGSETAILVTHNLGHFPYVVVHTATQQLATPAVEHISTSRFTVTVPTGSGTIVYG